MHAGEMAWPVLNSIMLSGLIFHRRRATIFLLQWVGVIQNDLWTYQGRVAFTLPFAT
jgi:hypothetical protein